MNKKYNENDIYVPGFVKVLKSYESTIDAYIARCKKKKIEPVVSGDDIFRAQMGACRKLHSAWKFQFRPCTMYDQDVINTLSKVLNNLVAEKMRMSNMQYEN